MSGYLQLVFIDEVLLLLVSPHGVLSEVQLRLVVLLCTHSVNSFSFGRVFAHVDVDYVVVSDDRVSSRLVSRLLLPKARHVSRTPRPVVIQQIRLPAI